MTNQTTQDNYLQAKERSVPQEMKQYKISLSGSAVSASSQFNDVKTCVVICDEAINFNLSYYDSVATSESPGDLLTAGTDARILYHPGGGASMSIAQNTEFNKIHAEIVAGTGTATVRIYPGGGMSQ